MCVVCLGAWTILCYACYVDAHPLVRWFYGMVGGGHAYYYIISVDLKDTSVEYKWKS